MWMSRSRANQIQWEVKRELLANDQNVLLCPICKQAYRDRRIYQCPDGHLFCSQCIATTCPNRRCYQEVSQLRTIRNRRLESLAFETNVLQLTALTTQYPPPRRRYPPANSLPGEDGEPSPNDNPEICYECGDGLPVYGIRFRCFTCTTKSFCQDCIEAGSHRQHSLILINSPGQAERANGLISSKKKKEPTNGEPNRR